MKKIENIKRFVRLEKEIIKTPTKELNNMLKYYFGILWIRFRNKLRKAWEKIKRKVLEIIEKRLAKADKKINKAIDKIDRILLNVVCKSWSF